jgi:hypothetical protein
MPINSFMKNHSMFCQPDRACAAFVAIAIAAKRNLIRALLPVAATEHGGRDHHALALVALVGAPLAVRAQVATLSVAAGNIIEQSHLSPLCYIFGSNLLSGGLAFCFFLLKQINQLLPKPVTRVFGFSGCNFADGRLPAVTSGCDLLLREPVAVKFGDKVNPVHAVRITYFRYSCKRFIVIGFPHHANHGY